MSPSDIVLFAENSNKASFNTRRELEDTSQTFILCRSTNSGMLLMLASSLRSSPFYVIQLNCFPRNSFYIPLTTIYQELRQLFFLHHLNMPSTVQVALPRWLQDYAPPIPFVNVHYQRTRQESCAWTRQYNFFPDEKQTAYENENSELLASLSHPYFKYEVLRLSCDLTNILFVVDVTTDHQCLADVEETCNFVLVASRDPLEPPNSKFSLAMADFMNRYDRLARPNSRERLLSHLEAYLETVVTQAWLREQGKTIDSVDSFRIERRDNSAIKLCFDILELGLGIDLPQAVYDTKEFVDVYLAAVDLVWLSNEVYSYCMEKSIGHREYNVISIYMKQHGMDLQGAFNHADREFRRIWAQLQDDRRRLPSFGTDVDADIECFFDGLIQWIEGMLHWSFETPRYFGDLRYAIRASHTLVI